MTDKCLILNGDTFTNEAVRRNLAAGPDGGVLLNLDEGSNLGVVPYRATVEVDEIGLEDFYVGPKADAVSNRHVELNGDPKETDQDVAGKVLGGDEFAPKSYPAMA